MNKEEIMIREAQIEDAAAVIDFLKIVTKETGNLLMTSKDALALRIENEEKILKRMLESPNSIFLVAVEKNEIIGTANLRALNREKIQHRASFGLSIIKKYWGKGIGSRLLNDLVSYAKSTDLEILELEVRSDNLRAIHLYQKLGFKEYGLYKNFMLEDGKYYDGLLMNLNLKS